MKKIIITAISLAVLLFGAKIMAADYSSFSNKKDAAVQKNQNSISLAASNDNPENIGKTSFSFAVMGDTKSFSANNSKGNLEKAVSQISKDNVDFSFVMGDLISSCDGGNSCEAKYNDWKNTLGPLVSKTYEVMGNHDRTGGDKADAVWQKEFNLPGNGPGGFDKLTYSFDFGNSHFVVLDSEKPKEHIINDAQRSWLVNDLKQNQNKNIFVFYHEPAFAMAKETEDGLDANPKERDAFWDILKQYKVKAVFNGHEHIFARKKIDGIYQIVVGDTDSTNDDYVNSSAVDFGYKGKSFAIVKVDGEKISLDLYSVDGNLINSFNLQ